ncbi:hypothetical protein MTO96_002767 [Rhipicephalus appendiculatus]
MNFCDHRSFIGGLASVCDEWCSGRAGDAFKCHGTLKGGSGSALPVSACLAEEASEGRSTCRRRHLAASVSIDVYRTPVNIVGRPRSIDAAIGGRGRPEDDDDAFEGR